MKKTILFRIIVGIFILAILYYLFFNHEFMFNTKPTELSVTTVSIPYKSNVHQFKNAVIKNKSDIQSLYQIIVKSPSVPNGTLQCMMGGPSYKLVFKNKLHHQFSVIVHPDGCGEANINFLNNRVIRDRKFWDILGKELKVSPNSLG